MKERHAERLATVEEKTKNLEESVNAHSDLITRIEVDIRALGSDVKGIKKALYFMAVAMMGQIPQVDKYLSVFLKILGL